MSLAKVTYDSLILLAEKLAKCADDIMADKTQLDDQLGSFLWDDPVGVGFYNKYEEGFAPIQNKLIPAIKDYIQYIEMLESNISEYSPIGVASGVALGAASGIVMHRAAITGSNGYTIKEGKQKKEKFIFSRKEDYKKLTTQGDNKIKYKKRKELYLKALNEQGLDIKYDGISTEDVDAINSKVFSMKDKELIVEFPENLEGEGPSTLGIQRKNVAQVSKSVARSRNSSTCEFGAVGAHESTHVLQYKKYKELEAMQQFSQLSKDEKDFVSNFKTTYPAGSKEYYSDPMEIDARISEYAFNDACNEYIKQQTSKKQTKR